MRKPRAQRLWELLSGSRLRALRERLRDDVKNRHLMAAELRRVVIAREEPRVLRARAVALLLLAVPVVLLVWRYA